MELRDYLQVYWRQRWLILAIVVIGTAAAAIVASTRPERTAVSISLAINRINRENTTQYQYDGYYALQASDLFAQTVVSWYSTPSVLREIYQQANLDPEIQSINSLPARFSVHKYSAQNIVIKFTERNDSRARQIATVLPSVMEAKATALNQRSDGKAQFDIVGGQPVIAPSKPNVPIVALVAAMLSLAIGLFVAATRHYLRQT